MTCANVAFGVVANIEQVDGQGGYYVTLSLTGNAWATAMSIMQCLHGRANLQVGSITRTASRSGKRLVDPCSDTAAIICRR